jgi:asparagine synthase (glutamine-hydrolysing)
MCGIAGVWRFGGAPGGALEQQARAMADAIRHRGPDSAGVWIDAEAGVALGHRRLAIIDLSPLGDQPMASADGRFVTAYNGEIYNFQELRTDLEAAGVRFRGSSDTEVLVEGCALWGVEAFAPRLNGMFAFALWDRAQRRLTLGRDAIGIKPLYWRMGDGRLMFGSELKALRQDPDFRPLLDRQSAASYFRYGYVPAPWTIYAGVRKLTSGALLTINADGSTHEKTFWSWSGAVDAARATSPMPSDAEAVDRLEALLRDAVGRQMYADAPLGVFLSGGVDSSVVAALAQAQSNRPVQSFAIGFEDAAYDESPAAARVAAHLGCAHTELRVDWRHALDVVPKLATMYDEPLSDPSQIPTSIVSTLTREHVKVVLSGDGGDELFAGYERYFHALKLTRIFDAIPRPLRPPLAHVLGAVPATAIDRIGEALRLQRLGTRLRTAGGLLGATGRMRLYEGLMSLWAFEANPVRDAAPRPAPFSDAGLITRFPDDLERMQYIDSVTYLPDDILAKVDRASMAASLEARVPLLDVRVAEMAWTLARSQKLRAGRGKWALREVLYRHVPPELVDRPKMGFGAPVGEWIRGALRDWAEDLLSPQALEADGVLEPALIRARWREHLEGRFNWQYPLWAVLMFQSWRRTWL